MDYFFITKEGVRRRDELAKELAEVLENMELLRPKTYVRVMKSLRVRRLQRRTLRDSILLGTPAKRPSQRRGPPERL